MARRPYFLVIALVVGSVSQTAGLQSVPKPQLVTPELVMAVESLPGSPDVVQVTIAEAGYSEQMLTAQIESLAGSFGAEVSGLQIIPATDSSPLRAVFSVPGIINHGSGDIQLQPIIRAFMSGDEDSLHAFSITFHGVSPTAYTTLASYKSPSAVLQAYYDQSKQTLEYRVLALTEDPEELVIPTRFVPGSFEPVSEEPATSRVWILVALMVLSGGSAGALVYFALLGRQS